MFGNDLGNIHFLNELLSVFLTHIIFYEEVFTFYVIMHVG